MLKFIVRFFAFIGFLVVALIVFGVVAYTSESRLEPEPDSVVMTIDFTKPIVEQNDSSPLTLAVDNEPIALLDILNAIDHALNDPHVKGIAAKFGTEQMSFVHAQEINEALGRFRKSGKFTYAYGTDFGEYGLGNRTYFLASAFENIWLQPVGTVSLTGLGIQSPFAKDALDKYGVTADFMKREEYKSLMEIAQRNDFSPLVKAEMQGMLDNLAAQEAEGIAANRKWDVDHVKDLMSRGPFTDDEALQEGLVTKLAYADEFDDELVKKAGKDAKQIDVCDYLNYVSNGEGNSAATIAVIYGVGMIMDKNRESDILGEQIMGADTIVQAFNDAADDDEVKAIIFRIDSPGGSPGASESIRRAMMHAQSKGKPVIVSMGETAASGGYWIAMNGDKIIADPSTLTGSIGVVGGKFAFDGALQKLGVTIDGVSTSPNAGMWNMTTPFNAAQKAKVNDLLDNTYRSFVGDVSAARKIPMEKMPDIAKGRVFTGEQAVKIGLIDEVGGYESALRLVRNILNLEEKAVLSIESLPAPPTAMERLIKILHRLGAESAEMASFSSQASKLQAAFTYILGAGALSDHPVAARLQMEPVHD